MARRVALAHAAVLMLSLAPSEVAAETPLARARTWGLNLVSRAEQKLERFALRLKAARGGFREGQLVQTRTSTRRTADGGRAFETTFFEVSRGRLRPELVIRATRDRRGVTTSTARSYPGNLRRLASRLTDQITESVNDPDFPAARRGDGAAQARYAARYQARQARYDRESAAARPKPFVDPQGRVVFLEGIKE